jgi:DNA-binding NarL/FixJ family response regulator
LSAGADGYLLKNAGYEEMLLAIRSVLAGRSYLSPAVSRQVIDGYLEALSARRPSRLWGLLSKRERQVLKRIAEGEKNRQIAEALGISIKTVEKHRTNLMRKLDLHNAAALTTFAIEKGLVGRQGSSE